MSGFTDATEVAVLDAMLGVANLGIFPNPVFLGLSTADPLDDGSGLAEPVGGSYARQSVPNDGPNWPAASGDPTSKANGATVAFPTATALWGVVTHWFLADAVSGGSVLASAPLDTAKAIDDGDTAQFDVGTVVITLE